ncbi:MAG TPA: hypothetical protein VF395_12835, partial [Polyangiaceae bacterium]
MERRLLVDGFIMVDDPYRVAQGACSAFAAWMVVGCAPPADFRPPSALVFREQTLEVGAGVVNVSKRPYVDESSRNIGQSWLTVRAASWVSFSAISAFDREGAAGGGAALFRLFRTDRVVVGTSAEAGYAWAGASASGALRLLEDSWLYTAPRVSNWGDVASLGIPVGLSIHVVEGLHLRTEVQWSWAGLKYYNRRMHTGLAAA